MLKRITDFFSNNISINIKEPGADTEHHVRIATCALLIEIASIDEEFDPVEKDRIADHFKDDFGLSEDKIKELFDLARYELSDRIDLWGFTNLINQHYTREQKMKVIENVWDVIYADGKLSAHEDYLVHKLYKMLNLTHKQLIEAKMKALERFKKRNE